MSIFLTNDLDAKLLELLDVTDDYSQMIINKYYYELIMSRPLYTE